MVNEDLEERTGKEALKTITKVFLTPLGFTNLIDEMGLDRKSTKYIGAKAAALGFDACKLGLYFLAAKALGEYITKTI